MNMKMIAGACLCAAAIAGCVSIDSLQTQIKSGDASQIADAKAKITEIITVGKSGLSTFDVAKRQQCAEMVTDSGHALEIIRKMAKPEPMYINPQSTPNEVIEAHRGLEASANHPVFRTLLSKVDLANQDVSLEVLTLVLDNCGRESGMRFGRGRTGATDNCGRESGLENIVSQIVSGLSDKETLLSLQAQCYDYRSYKNHELRMMLHENHIVIDRLIALSPSQKELIELIDRDLNWAGSGKSAGLGIKEYVLEKVTDNALLLSLAAKVDNDKLFQKEVYDRITDEKILVDFAINVKNDHWQATMSEAGANAVEKINNPDCLVNIALLAQNSYVALKAREKLSLDDYLKGIAKLLSEGKLEEKQALKIVDDLKDDQATIAMYDAAKQRAVQSALFAKLKAADRASVRARNRGECEKKIATAKEKGKETFELGGFYLGMNISDVDELVGYYCPEWSNSEDYVDDDKTLRGLWVPQQKGAFCRAGKDGKVFEFNFGKNFLKNFYKFDVQNEREWAAAYSRKEGVDLRYVHLNEDVKVVDYNDPGVPYHALYSQDTYTYKNNSKDYRVTYFGEQKIAAGNGIVKQAARGQMQYVGGQQGMLRVRIEKD